MTDARKPPGRYHHGDLRAALVTAAVEILEENGIGALSLRAVARRAGVSQTAPYRHFADKEALLAAVAAEGFRGLMASMAAKREGVSGSAARLRAIGEGYVAFATGHPGLLRLMFGPEIPNKAAHEELIEPARDAFMVLSDTVTDRLAPADAASVAPEIATLAAWSLVHGLATLLVDRQIAPFMTGGRDPDDLVAEILGLFGRSLASRPD